MSTTSERQPRLAQFRGVLVVGDLPFPPHRSQRLGGRATGGRRGGRGRAVAAVVMGATAWSTRPARAGWSPPEPSWSPAVVVEGHARRAAVAVATRHGSVVQRQTGRRDPSVRRPGDPFPAWVRVRRAEAWLWIKRNGPTSTAPHRNRRRALFIRFVSQTPRPCATVILPGSTRGRPPARSGPAPQAVSECVRQSHSL